MAKNNRNRVIGSTVPELKGKEVHQETIEFMTKKFNKGYFNVFFGQGATSNHAVYDLFTPLSICGRNVGEISSKPIITPLGRMCLGCRKIYEESFHVWLAERKQAAVENEALAEDINSTVTKVEKLMKTDKKWSLSLMGF